MGSNSPSTIFLAIESGLFPLKGYDKVISSYIIQPKDQISALFV